MIQVEDLCVRQGRFGLDRVTFTVPRGRYAVLMGKTGSGKTTILEAIAGLRPVVGGRVRLGERDVTRLPPAARTVGYVPQDGALFRTMTVFDNLAFGLTIRGAPAARVADRVRELADWLDLAPLLDRRAVGLSGGETQRIALGRALAVGPPVLLLDEPLSSLDEDTRDRHVALLLALRERRDVTVLHVSHSRQEARALGDLILRVQDGRVVLHQPDPLSGANHAESITPLPGPPAHRARLHDAAGDRPEGTGEEGAGDRRVGADDDKPLLQGDR